MGYNTLIGDMGAALSGGQKQRILLARALYKQPRILFLDEATSALDMQKERAVNEAIRSLDLTRIIVAHRPETIASADRVIVLLEKDGGMNQFRKGEIGLGWVHEALKEIPEPAAVAAESIPDGDSTKQLLDSWRMKMSRLPTITVPPKSTTRPIDSTMKVGAFQLEKASGDDSLNPVDPKATRKPGAFRLPGS